jgi:pectin lyase
MTENVLLYAVKNYWYAISGHAFDIGSGPMVLAEGNVFQNVVTPLFENLGKLFSSPSAAANPACTKYLGHACIMNVYGNSGSFSGSDTNFFTDFSGKTIAGASAASANVAKTAGVGKI